MTPDIRSQLDAVIAPFQASIDAANSIPALVDATEKVNYDLGFADGQASIILPSPTDPTANYTQADMDALAVLVRSENKAQLEAKDEEIAAIALVRDGLQAQVDDFSNQVSNAVSLVKSDLLAKYKELQVVIQTSETGFEDNLK